MRPPVHLLAAGLLGCSPERSTVDRTGAPEAVMTAAEACDRGDRDDCDAARADLAEAERRDRMARYAATIEAGPR
nr:hypothetical protein [uncultured Brevundimonas sp.]